MMLHAQFLPFPYNKRVRRHKELFVLGREYEITYNMDYNGKPRKPRVVKCRFVQVTKKGFNLLDLETNRCLLDRHMYPVAEANGHYQCWVNDRMGVEAL